MKSIWENTNEDTYQNFAVIKDCYDALIDEKSRKIFQARMAFDLGDWDGYIDLVRYSGLMTEEEILENYGWVNTFSQTKQPVYIYGAGQFGGHVCTMLQKKGVNIVGFFDRNYANIVERCGLPVLEPPKSGDDSLKIFISPTMSIDEIIQGLCQNGLTKQNFLHRYSMIMNEEQQYFDFYDHYKTDGVFIDAGCFDFLTAVRFHHWSNAQYKKIISFEPDKKNLIVCRNNAQTNHIDRVQFVQAGLWETSETGCFGALGSSSSRIVNEGGESIQLVALDDVIGDDTVSFLKMDIEGAELSALRGAARTIMRDKPLCALSVYHKLGDQIALMKYLKELVPEYRFALRHYSNIAIETVLYAFL